MTREEIPFVKIHPLARVHEVSSICQQVDSSQECHCQLAVPGTHGVGMFIIAARIHVSMGHAMKPFIKLVQRPEDDDGGVQEDTQETHAGQEGGDWDGQDAGAFPQVEQNHHHSQDETYDVHGQAPLQGRFLPIQLWVVEEEKDDASYEGLENLEHPSCRGHVASDISRP